LSHLQLALIALPLPALAHKQIEASRRGAEAGLALPVWEGGRCKQKNLPALKSRLLAATISAKFVPGATDAAGEREALRIAPPTRAHLRDDARNTTPAAPMRV
jgi:hypothetical protein